MFQRLRQLADLLVEAAVLSVESIIERLGDPSRAASDREALRIAHERLAEFAEENARLEDEVTHWVKRVETLESILSEDEPSNDTTKFVEGMVHSSRARESCTCGERFRTAEDYRDHLPCGGRCDG